MIALGLKSVAVATLILAGSVALQPAPAKEARTMLSPQDVAEIRAMVPAMERAWRTHDAAAYAAQFLADAEHINAYGMWWRGRAEIEQGIAFALTRVYPDNPIAATDVSVAALASNIAVVQYRWRLKPYSDPDGTAYRDPQGRVSEVLIRTDAGWRIRNFQSTFINPNVPPSHRPRPRCSPRSAA